MLSGLHRASLEGILRHPKYAAIWSKVQFFLDDLLDIRISLTGNDLISLGVREGESVGKMLASLHNARLEGVVTTREDEIAFVRNHKLN